MISLKNPNFFCAKISHLRINKSEDIILYTDVSKRTGCGAWLSHCDGRIIEEGFIRWSKEEIELFEKRLISSASNSQAGVSINVLEFFSVVYFVLIWRDKLKGCVVKTNCDNTATVAWLKRMRASGQSWVSESLMKLFSLVCLKFGKFRSSRKYKGQGLVERSIGNGGFAKLLAEMHSSAMGSSLARSTQASRDSAVIAWNRFCEIAVIDIFCRYEKEPYSVSETIYVVMAFASFESIRGIIDKPMIYLRRISPFCQKNVSSVVMSITTSVSQSNQIKSGMSRGVTRRYITKFTR